MKKNSCDLSSGGIVMKIFSNEDCIFYIGLLLFGKKYINVRYDDYFFFQKLTSDEKIILLSFDCIEQFSEHES